jgi:hypothetical protein
MWGFGVEYYEGKCLGVIGDGLVMFSTYKCNFYTMSSRQF